jgi:hyperosmotically inducible periplasmic protein
MKTPQLLCLLVLGATVACNRPEADAKAQRAAEQVSAVAAKTGHQLADSWLTTKIQAQYFADDDIKARNINVSTRDKIVTLTGYVDNEPQRELAVQIAKTTDGVQQVNDRLTLSDRGRESGAIATTGAAPSSGPAEPVRQAFDDAQLTARVQSQFFVDDRVKGRRINVDSSNGVVTLTGDVASEDERAQALLLARTTDGVQRVEDHLTVAPPADNPPAGYPPGTAEVPSAAPPPMDDSMVMTTIQAKYFVDPTVKGSAVEVSVKDGVVQLQGTVPSEAVRKQAIAIAQNTEGVDQVVDRITIASAKKKR